MEVAIEIIRWAGLVLALLLTVVVLKEVALVLRTLVNISTLAERIRDAAEGVARHVEPAERAPELAEPVGRFRDAGRRFSAAAGTLADRLSDVTPTR